tara:strand:+ start:1484 stop:1726 length:243 start_codon:yes stop_codon:yes gene_type:complete
MKEAILCLWAILIYVMRRSGTLSIDEKMYILDLIGYISRRAGHVDGATLLEEAKQYQPSQVDRLLAPSPVSKNPEHIPHP